jgi:hypothetical protein
MLLPLKWVGKEYKTLINKLATNNAGVELTKANLLNMCDIDMILGLPCILPMLEFVNGLMKFAQSRNVFVWLHCNYQNFPRKFVQMYNDFNTSFQLENFPKFIDVVTNTSCTIT